MIGSLRRTDGLGAPALQFMCCEITHAVHRESQTRGICRDRNKCLIDRVYSWKNTAPLKARHYSAMVYKAFTSHATSTAERPASASGYLVGRRRPEASTSLTLHGLAVRGASSPRSSRKTPRGGRTDGGTRKRGFPTEEGGASRVEGRHLKLNHPRGFSPMGAAPTSPGATCHRLSRCGYWLLDAVPGSGKLGDDPRTAAAFGSTATVALSGTVDLWNAKSSVAGWGRNFSIPALLYPGDEARHFRRDR